MEKLEFPADFEWGAATAAFQIEGGREERGDSVWDAFCKVRGAIRDGSDGSIACDHYRRYKEDVAILSALGVDNYRFSAAWPRVMPDGETPNERGWILRQAGGRAARKGHNALSHALSLGFAPCPARARRLAEQRYARIFLPLRVSVGFAAGRQGKEFYDIQRTAMLYSLRLPPGRPRTRLAGERQGAIIRHA